MNTVILTLLTTKIGSKVASQDDWALIYKMSRQDILHNKRSSADTIKNFEMRSSWIISVDLAWLSKTFWEQKGDMLLET